MKRWMPLLSINWPRAERKVDVLYGTEDGCRWMLRGTLIDRAMAFTESGGTRFRYATPLDLKDGIWCRMKHSPPTKAGKRIDALYKGAAGQDMWQLCSCTLDDAYECAIADTVIYWKYSNKLPNNFKYATIINGVGVGFIP